MAPKSEKTTAVAFRLPPSLIRQVDGHAKYLRGKTGMNVSRCAAVRALLTEALEKQGKQK